jgi:4'-phosphopantetheinyl transferase
VTELHYLNFEKASEASFLAACKLLSPDERVRAFAYRNECSRRQTVFARYLLAARLSAGQTLSLEYTPSGKPLCAALGHISISHTDNMVCVAISNREIGVDIELIRQSRACASTRFWTEEEQAFIQNSTRRDKAFLHLWTRKEAFLKAQGGGWHGSAGKYSCIHDTIHESEQGKIIIWHLQSFNLSGSYTGALCTRDYKDEYTLQEAALPF